MTHIQSGTVDLVAHEQKRTITIQNLFPSPIGFSNFHRDLTDDEMSFLLDQNRKDNQGNMSSINSYILKDKRMSALRQFIEDSLDDYFAATWNPKDNIRLKITQSWVNYTEPGQYHHKHAHPNSLVSGCFYISAIKETDKIYFYRDCYKQILITPSEWNMFNSESWWYPVETGQLILFPSSMQHMVEAVKGDSTRISLAFNAFPVGKIGKNSNMTELYL